MRPGAASRTRIRNGLSVRRTGYLQRAHVLNGRNSFEPSQEVDNGPAECRMDEARSEIGKRFEHEPAFVHSRVRYDESFRYDRSGIVQEEVEIDRSGTVHHSPRPTEPAFDSETDGEQRLRRRKFSLELDDRVQEVWLIEKADRTRLVDRRESDRNGRFIDE